MKKLTLKTKIIVVLIAYLIFVTAVTALIKWWVAIPVIILSAVVFVTLFKALDLICNIGVLDLKMIRFSKKLENLCKKASNIVIMGHKYSDLDSIGASYGLYSYLSTKYDVSMLLNKENTLGRPLVDLICFSDKTCKFYGESDIADIVGEDTLLIVVDTHRPVIMDFYEAYEKAG
ncbi:MAG: hypothetical protein J6V50_06325, partial [Clostridia bacterium]|nr:hypothetical protein [Clostridia bacterium]